MGDEESNLYELPVSIRLPWVSRSLRQLMDQQRHLPHRSAGAAVGIAVSILIHAALLGSVVLGGARSALLRRSAHTGAAASMTSEGDEEAMTVIFIDTFRRDFEQQRLASRATVTQSIGLKVASLDALVDLTFPDVTVKADDKDDEQVSDDPVRRAMLAGRYTGQIKARIERAWVRPRTPIGVSHFSCQVQIVQDRSGAVKETSLQTCQGDARWQLSLIQAIQRAAPLPAPPDPAVFTSAISLRFESDAFDPLHGELGFEREPATAAPLSHLTKATTTTVAGAAAHRADSIRLTIQGDRVDIQPAIAGSGVSSSASSPPSK
jgi:hypothetical protein